MSLVVDEPRLEEIVSNSGPATEEQEIQQAIKDALENPESQAQPETSAIDNTTFSTAIPKIDLPKSFASELNLDSVVKNSALGDTILMRGLVSVEVPYDMNKELRYAPTKAPKKQSLIEFLPFRQRPKKEPVIGLIQKVVADKHMIKDSSKVRITSTDRIPSGTKSVWKIYYKLPKEDRILHALLFEYDPQMLMVEYQRLKIAHKHGLPTGEPFDIPPGCEGKYPYNFAIVAGTQLTSGSYYDLLKSMRRDNELMHKAVIDAAKSLAGWHASLTNARSDFEKANIPIPYEDPETELRRRFLEGRRKVLAEMNIGDESDRYARSLIEAFNSFFRRTSMKLVISHGDIHGDNIRTKQDYHSTSTKEFGIIDLSDLVWALPHKDLISLWIHHLRYVNSVCETPYRYGFRDVEEGYLQNLRMFFSDGLPSQRECEIDREYQYLYCSTNEIFDPQRPLNQSSIIKARLNYYHFRLFVNYLIEKGIDEAREIDSAMLCLVKDIPFLKSISKAV